MKIKRIKSAFLVGIVALLVAGIVWGSVSVAEVSAAAKARRAKRQNVVAGQVVDDTDPSAKRQNESAATKQALQKRNRDGSCGECDGTCPYAQDGSKRAENRGKTTDSSTGANKQERKRDGTANGEAEQKRRRDGSANGEAEQKRRRDGSANGEAEQKRNRDGSGADKNRNNGNQNGAGTGGNRQRKRDGSGNGQGNGVCPF